MIGLLRKHRWFRTYDLRASYDAVVIGGGAHGMATAYYLAKDHGMKNVAVLEQSYIGAGASGKSDPRAIAAEPFTLSVMFVPPGQGNAAHTHEVEEVFFILDGYADPALQAKRDVHLGAARG